MSQVANNINNCSDKTTLDGIDISQYEELRPPYPLMFNVEDLFKKNDYKYRQTLKTVNSFFIYRKAMVKQNEKGRKKCDMPTLSKIASIFWRQEPPHIKNSYKKLAKDAQDLFAKQIDLLQTINAGKSLGFPQSQPQPQTATIHPIRLPSTPTINANNNKRTPVDTSPYHHQKPRFSPIQNTCSFIPIQNTYGFSRNLNINNNNQLNQADQIILNRIDQVVNARIDKLMLLYVPQA